MNWLGKTLSYRSEIDLRKADIREFLGERGWLERADADALAPCCALMAVNYNDNLEPKVQAARLLPTYHLWRRDLGVEADETTATRAMKAWIAYCQEL